MEHPVGRASSATRTHEKDSGMTKRVVILGAGGFAREVADILRDLGTGGGLELLGFVDRDASRRGELLNDAYVLGTVGDLEHPAELFAVAGSGDLAIRKRQIAEIESAGMTPLTVVHPSVIMTPFVALGEGTIVCAGTILTNRVRVGEHVVLNLGVTVGHDVTIGNRCVVSPGVHISGEVEIGEGCSLGTGAVVLPGLHVGDSAVIGAGAVVTKDVEPEMTVVGVPARPVGARA